MIQSVSLVQIALRIGGLSLVAVGGGNALIPALHEQLVVSLHWLTESRFAESVALSQIAPGPNMLLMPLMGGEIAGVAGAFVALAAFVLPSTTIAILGSRMLVRHAQSRVATAFTWALRPVTGGLMLSSAIVLVGTAAHAWPASGPITLPILGAGAVLVALLSLRFRFNPLVWLAAAAVIGASAVFR